MEDIAMKLSCVHLFHTDCLVPWLEKHHTCPVCRKELPTDNLEFENRGSSRAEENFLNQNLSQSSIQHFPLPGNSANQSSVKVNKQPNFRISMEPSPIQQANDISYAKNSKNLKRGDPNYACLAIKKLEFFCTKENLIKFSNYMSRLFDKQSMSYNVEERNS